MKTAAQRVEEFMRDNATKSPKTYRDALVALVRQAMIDACDQTLSNQLREDIEHNYDDRYGPIGYVLPTANASEISSFEERLKRIDELCVEFVDVPNIVESERSDDA